MQSDPHRPTYHFVVPEGHAGIFDPNGAIYWKGKYHLGFIYHKTINGKQRYVWGHVVSIDLLHWTIYPDMLDVEEGDPAEGIFSGGAFLTREGRPGVAYYGLGATANFVAYASDDDLKVWKKQRYPILETKDPDDPGDMSCCVPAKGKFSVFDPEVWYDRRSNYYYQISGGMKPGLFRSKDMGKWQYLGNVLSTENTMRYPFEDISCPDFFSLGRKSMLLFISHALGAQYYIGTFVNSRFTPEQHERMNWPGGSFHAAEQLQDGKGRNVLWGWIFPEYRPPHLKDYGWAGVMSLPRVVALNDAGELQISPAEELQTIRLKETFEDAIVLQPHEETMLRAGGNTIELQMEMLGGSRSPFGVRVFVSPDGREETTIRYEPEQEQLVIDFVKSSIRAPVSVPVFNVDAYNPSKPLFEQATKGVSEQRVPLKLEKGEALKLDIFLDRSIIEVFANKRRAVTQVVYPELGTSIGVRIFAGNEEVAFRNIKSWTLAETNAY